MLNICWLLHPMWQLKAQHIFIEINPDKTEHSLKHKGRSKCLLWIEDFHKIFVGSSSYGIFAIVSFGTWENNGNFPMECNPTINFTGTLTRGLTSWKESRREKTCARTLPASFVPRNRLHGLAFPSNIKQGREQKYAPTLISSQAGVLPSAAGQF